MNAYLKNEIKKIDSIYRDYTVFFALSGIGDICYCFYALNAIKVFNNKKIVVFTKSDYIRLIECFCAVDEIVILSEEHVKTFLLLESEEDFSFFNCFDDDKHIFYCNALKEEKYLQFINGNNQYPNLNDIIKSECEKHVLNFNPSLANVKLYENSSNYIDYNNSVIINPYSNTMIPDSLDVFQSIADDLIKNGYNVYTNVVDNQQVLSGTRRLECSINEFYEICKKVRGVISIRSGIVDFCIGSGGKFIVIYTDMWNGLFRKAFDLEGWKSKSEIVQIELSDNNAIEKISCALKRI